MSAAIGVCAFLRDLSSACRTNSRAGEDLRHDREGVDPRVEHAEAARLEDPLLARVPFVHILVPPHRHRLDALAGKRLRRRVDRRIVLRVPGREQGRAACAFGQAVEIGDLGEARCRRLFEQAVEAGEDAFARDLVARAGRSGDRHRFQALDAADQLAPVGEGRSTPCPERLDVATSSKRGLALIEGTCWSSAILP